MTTKTYTFAALPKTADELRALPEADMKDPFAVAALAIAALCAYPGDKKAAIEMLNALKGPSKLSPMDEQFIRDRFMDKDYVPRSYFKGAKPENNYRADEPFTIEVQEAVHSRDQEAEGYLTLYLQSGGADSARPIKLRTKPSTGEWFLWEFSGILAGIRIPAAEDAWA